MQLFLIIFILKPETDKKQYVYTSLFHFFLFFNYHYFISFFFYSLYFIFSPLIQVPIRKFSVRSVCCAICATSTRRPSNIFLFVHLSLGYGYRLFIYLIYADYHQCRALPHVKPFHICVGTTIVSLLRRLLTYFFSPLPHFFFISAFCSICYSTSLY